MVNLFSAPPLVVHECPPLVVLDDLLYVKILDLHQVCLGGIEVELTVVLGILNVIHQFL